MIDHPLVDLTISNQEITKIKFYGTFYFLHAQNVIIFHLPNSVAKQTVSLLSDIVLSKKARQISMRGTSQLEI